ncbi:MAG TPA: cyclic nucleotide-binding domain-containing protein [Gaiellaceae bacterium]|nr:cyclic nucleotide-binding domain-containing protein [Gaiellaceae bacterium]
MDTKTALIKQVPLFQGCSKQELAEVAALADEIDLPAGRTLTTEGASGKEFVVLIEGTAEVRHDGELVNELGPGDFLGEIALVTGQPRTATVTTRSPSKLLVMNAQAFRSLLAGAPELKRRVVATAALRVAG